jgi:hypothetical protein
LKLLEKEKSKSSLYDGAWNRAVNFLKDREMITSTSVTIHGRKHKI